MLEQDPSRGMTLIVKTVTRLTLGFILLYGIYIALTGHVSPGGGFVGGVIVALSFVHIMLAFGKEVALKRLHSKGLRFAINVCALLFLAIVMVSFSGKVASIKAMTGLMKVFHACANEFMLPVCELVIVGAGLFTVFMALVLLCRASENAKGRRD
jgi:multicomponent Na+:H+ antiporter subunit B